MWSLLTAAIYWALLLLHGGSMGAAKTGVFAILWIASVVAFKVLALPPAFFPACQIALLLALMLAVFLETRINH